MGKVENLIRDGEIAQWLIVHIALAEDSGLFLGTYIR